MPGSRLRPAAFMLAAVFLVRDGLAVQGLVVRSGNQVRITWTSIDPAADDWIRGVVTQTTYGERVSLTPVGSEQATTVILDESARLQVYSGRRAHWQVGALIGGGVGAILGGALLSEGFGNRSTSSDAFERSQGAVLFGVLGAAAGALVSFALGREGWVEIPLVDGMIRMPPLTANWIQGGTVSGRARQYWTSFPATELDFGAFFERHANDLEQIEGMWELVGGTRFAVVRDSRYPGMQYVAVRVSRVNAPSAAYARTADGPIFAAIREGGPNGWQVRAVEPGTAFSGQTLEAERSGPLLVVSYRGTVVEQWVKVFP